MQLFHWKIKVGGRGGKKTCSNMDKTKYCTPMLHQQQHREALRGEELAKALTVTLRTVPDFPKPGLERFSD